MRRGEPNETIATKVSSVDPLSDPVAVPRHAVASIAIQAQPRGAKGSYRVVTVLVGQGLFDQVESWIG